MSACTMRRQSGFSLIEFLFAFAIVSVLVGLALPSFRTMLQNSQVRTAAESIQSGLQRARAEAVLRNRSVAFALGAGSSWAISEVGGASIESRPSSEGSRAVTVTATAADSTAATTITYNNLGGVVTAASSLAQVDLDAPGSDRNLRVVIGVGGNARMCDPNVSPGSGLGAC